MKSTRNTRAGSIIVGVLAIGVASFGLAFAQSQSPASAAQKTPGNAQAQNDRQAAQEKAMQAWIESMKPTKAHAELAARAGTYDVTFAIQSMEGGQPSVSKAKATLRSTLGGKFLAEDFQGEMMGQPMSGAGMMGYDNVRKQYVMTWADSLATGILKFTGAKSREGDVITLFGEMDEPMTGEIGKTVKYVQRIVDADHFVAEMWEVQYGKEFMVWKADYARAK
ncbi:MAG: DUF1579 family protein [Phycisphaerales bacterium]